MNSFKTIIVLREDAPLPTSAAISLISAMEAKHELIVQAGGYVCKSTFIFGSDDAGTGETAIKVEVEVEPAVDGGKKVIKVKVNSSSYKEQQLLPVPRAEHGQAKADEDAATLKVKLD